MARVAVVGGGVAGLACAAALRRDPRLIITVFESRSYNHEDHARLIPVGLWSPAMQCLQEILSPSAWIQLQKHLHCVGVSGYKDTGFKINL